MPDFLAVFVADPTLVQVAVHAALDVCWPILPPDTLTALAYV